MSDISEVLPSEEALKRIWMAHNGTDRSKLEDMRIIVVYQTITDGYMIALFLMEGYHLMFMSKWQET